MNKFQLPDEDDLLSPGDRKAIQVAFRMTKEIPPGTRVREAVESTQQSLPVLGLVLKRHRSQVRMVWLAVGAVATLAVGGFLIQQRARIASDLGPFPGAPFTSPAPVARILTRPLPAGLPGGLQIQVHTPAGVVTMGNGVSGNERGPLTAFQLDLLKRSVREALSEIASLQVAQTMPVGVTAGSIAISNNGIFYNAVLQTKPDRPPSLDEAAANRHALAFVAVYEDSLERDRLGARMNPD
jgi:hypothetical protein